MVHPSAAGILSVGYFWLINHSNTISKIHLFLGLLKLHIRETPRIVSENSTLSIETLLHSTTGSGLVIVILILGDGLSSSQRYIMSPKSGIVLL